MKCISNQHNYWKSAASPPPENTTCVQGRKHYIAKEKDEKDKVLETYSTYYPYHCVCQNCMN